MNDSSDVIEAIDYILRTYPEARYAGARHGGHPILERLGTVRAFVEDTVRESVPGVPWLVKANVLTRRTCETPDA